MRGAVTALAWVVLAVLALPVLVPLSFSSVRYFAFPPPGWSGQWHANLLTSREWREALVTSAGIGAGATLLGVPASVALVRYRFPGKELLYAVLLSPLIMPTIVFAIGLYFTAAPLGLLGRPATIAAAHVVLGIAEAARRRGTDRLVPVSWDVALDHIAGELRRVRADHGNAAIYAGSYGWGSAGRFHHPQGQLHRFLNLIGGYVSHRGTYSIAAIEHILPHVIDMDWKRFTAAQSCWNSIAEHAQLLVCFGGMASRNAQLSPGGVGRHRTASFLSACAAKGVRFVNILPDRETMAPELGAQWLPIRPGTDTALMLALAHVLIANALHDETFLVTHCVGFDVLRDYILGHSDGISKTPAWAAQITGLPAAEIEALALRMGAARTMVTMSWSIQRTRFGEQPIWMGIALAAILGQIGLPGGGFGIGHGAVNHIGSPIHPVAWASLPQGVNPVQAYIPVARLSDMLLHPGAPFAYDGRMLSFPDIRLVYWAGDNPFHHQQDLHRLIRAWQRPETIVVHELQHNALAAHADIVLPAASPMERNDFAAALREDRVTAMDRLRPPFGEARIDFEIFRDLATRLGCEDRFTEGRDEEGWVRHLYAQSRAAAREVGYEQPDFDAFRQLGQVSLPDAPPTVLLADFRRDPDQFPLRTPSGRIELYSARIAAFGYDDCPPHPQWLADDEGAAPIGEAKDMFYLLSPQPRHKLHSQNDPGDCSQLAKRDGREMVTMHAADAAALGIADGDVVELYNARGRTLAAARLVDTLRRGVVSLPTGTWLHLVETAQGLLDWHGNPNVLTRDMGTSRLSQGTTAMTCLVKIRRARLGPQGLTGVPDGQASVDQAGETLFDEG